MPHRKNILWLVSWYPDRIQPTNGDFIERHALAASEVANIIVLHVVWDPQATHKACLEKDERHAPHLVVYRWYDVPSACRIGWLRKLLNFRKYVQAFIRSYRMIRAAHGPFDFIHVHVCWKAGLAALCLKWLSGQEYFLSEHASYFQPASPRSYWKDHLWKRLLVWLILRQAKLWLPVSDDLGCKLQSIAGRKPIHVLPNAVNTTLFSYLRKVAPDVHSSAMSKRRFIHVSDLQPHKRPEAMIAAFEQIAEQLPGWQLHLVGPVRDDVKKRIQTSVFADRICMTGWLTPTEVTVHLQQADVFVMYSSYENQPCAILEALCCGLPVIAPRVGGIPELINNRNGLLIVPEDTQALSQAMLKIAHKLEDFNRETISHEASLHYGFPAIVEHFRHIYACHE
ncbi:glycosyltransferase involved in cell wall biosynthesis [Thermoflavifilum aggregans]|uniref:Glycosyltransferase involved in cell wall biosynthesis n=1 Tax=Thermoflavifilum aggregans TaxID=454188 RepID=A0A2M9CTN3_9BACT|nr:glycosyltransferase [Thermoflavifilum aggregans]PJJ75239.1 glycosyltransferase involved in cell wall biosynthesis [Thermoflavifilum aggregans]